MMARTNTLKSLVVTAAIALAIAAAYIMLVGPPASAANTLVVDDDRAQCPTAAFTSIQQAVGRAKDGDTITV